MIDMYENMSLVNPQDAMGIYGAALPAGMKQDMYSQLGQQFLNQPQAMQQPQQMQAPQQVQNDPVAQRMAQAQEQQRNQAAMKMMGQGIANMGRNQMAMPSGNTAQIMRDQGGPRMQGNQQQMMAQMLRRR